jgi:hypothetical protein
MARRMPSCVGLTHGQIWKLLLECYGQDLREQELRDIHQRWTRLGAEAGFRRVRDK